MKEQTAPRIARPTVRVSDGDYTLELPTRDPYDWRDTDAVPTIRAQVFGSDAVFVSFDNGLAGLAMHAVVTPAAAHALAEAIHAVANRIEGKPADADRPGSADGIADSMQRIRERSASYD